jgi:hypothetical protein
LVRAFSANRGGNNVPPDVDRQQTDKDLIHLPAAMVGIGLTSYHSLLSVSWSASRQLADSVLASFVADIAAPGTIVSQVERVEEQHNNRYDAFMDRLGSPEMLRVMDHSTQVGRKWLSVLPSTEAWTISNHDVQSTLHVRTLKQGRPICSRCGFPACSTVVYMIIGIGYRVLAHTYSVKTSSQIYSLQVQNRYHRIPARIVGRTSIP